MGRRTRVVMLSLGLLGAGAAPAAAAPYGSLAGPPSAIQGSTAVTVGPNGDLYVGDKAGLVHELRPDGTHVQTLTPPEANTDVLGLTVAANGDVIAYGYNPDGRLALYALGVDGTYTHGPVKQSCGSAPHQFYTSYSGIFATSDRVYVGGNCNTGLVLDRSLQPVSPQPSYGGGCWQRDGDYLLTQHVSDYLNPNAGFGAQYFDGTTAYAHGSGTTFGTTCIASGPNGRYYYRGTHQGQGPDAAVTVAAEDGTALGTIDTYMIPNAVSATRGYLVTGNADITSISIAPGSALDAQSLGADPTAGSGDPAPDPTGGGGTTDPAPGPVTPPPPQDGCGLIVHGAGDILGSDAADHLFGSDGDDVINGLEGDDCVEAGGGNDRVFGQGGADQIMGGDGDDFLHGMDGNDVIDGDDGDDTLYGGDGDDTLSPGAGHNLVNGQDGNDHIYGGAGTNEIYGETGDDDITGGDGPDVIHGQDGADTISGERGDDTAYGETGDDIMLGQEGDDVLYGQEGNDTLNGQAGNDTLDGEGGADKITGEAGNDKLKGGAGQDTLDGGAGKDVIDAADGERDVVTCGPGVDTVVADKQDKLKGCEHVTRVAAARLTVTCPASAALGCVGMLRTAGVEPAHFALSPGSRQLVVAAVRRPALARRSAPRASTAKGSTAVLLGARRVSVR